MSDCNETPNSGSGLQSILTWLVSCFSFLVSNATQSNIAWGVGLIAGCVAIYSGIMNIRAKRLEIRKLEFELKSEMSDEDSENHSQTKHKH
jgi:hypothetical protein